MQAALRPLQAPSLLRTAALASSRSPRRHGARAAASMAGGGSSKPSYPKPIVFDALGAHKSTMIMIHGLGDSGQASLGRVRAARSALPAPACLKPVAIAASRPALP